MTAHWEKIKAGSYGTQDGWNAWKRSDGKWNLRSPRGEYRTAATLREAKLLQQEQSR